MNEEECATEVEGFNLRYAARQLKSERIMSRVEGLKMFRKVIEKTQKPEEDKE